MGGVIRGRSLAVGRVEMVRADRAIRYRRPGRTHTGWVWRDARPDSKAARASHADPSCRRTAGDRSQAGFSARPDAALQTEVALRKLEQTGERKAQPQRPAASARASTIPSVDPSATSGVSCSGRNQMWRWIDPRAARRTIREPTGGHSGLPLECEGIGFELLESHTSPLSQSSHGHTRAKR